MASRKSKRKGGSNVVPLVPTAPAQHKRAAIDKELARICQRDGCVTAAAVVDAARDESSLLHAAFEWDDDVAGEKYRLEQARNMIRASKYLELLETVRAGRSQPKPCHVSVRAYITGRRGQGPATFKLRNEVLSDADDRAATVEQFLAELRSWCDRTVDITELSALRDVIARALISQSTRKAV